MRTLEPDKIEKYGEHYNEPGLWKKIATVARRAGSKVIYPVLLLYYVLQDENTPLKHKAMIIGALGYFILPIDIIPDILPILGFTDDLAALAACVKALVSSITPEIKEKAKRKLSDWF